MSSPQIIPQRGVGLPIKPVATIYYNPGVRDLKDVIDIEVGADNKILLITKELDERKIETKMFVGGPWEETKGVIFDWERAEPLNERKVIFKFANGTKKEFSPEELEGKNFSKYGWVDYRTLKAHVCYFPKELVFDLPRGTKYASVGNGYIFALAETTRGHLFYRIIPFKPKVPRIEGIEDTNNFLMVAEEYVAFYLANDRVGIMKLMKHGVRGPFVASWLPPKPPKARRKIFTSGTSLFIADITDKQLRLTWIYGALPIYKVERPW